MTEQSVRCVIVSDIAQGYARSDLVETYFHNQFTCSNASQIVPNHYQKQIEVGGDMVKLQIWSTSIFFNCYHSADVVIIFYNNLDDYENCYSMAENARRITTAPIIFCISRSELNDNNNDIPMFLNPDYYIELADSIDLKDLHSIPHAIKFDFNDISTINYLFYSAAEQGLWHKRIKNEQQKQMEFTRLNSISKNGITYVLQSSGNTCVINVDNDTTIIPAIISHKWKKIIIKEISLNKAAWPSLEFNFPNNSNITEIKNVNLKNVKKMDIPPLLETIDLYSIKTAKKLEMINILEP